MNAYKSIKEKLAQGKGDYPDPGKAGQMTCGCADETEEEKKDYLVTLRSDLANTYYWSGSFVRDYFFFVANWHPLLGILLCHPHHPWGKRARVQMLLISLFITMPPSVYIAKEADINAMTSGAKTSLVIFFVTIPDTIIGVLLYQLSIADTRCPACAGFFDVLNKCCMNCFFIWGIIAVLFCYFQLQGSDVKWTEALQPMFMGKVYSYLSWFPIWFVLPCMGFTHEWWMESKALAKEQGNESNE